MRISSLLTVTAVVFLAAGSVTAKPKWVQPQKDGVGVYKNQIRETYEEPITTASSNDRMEVVSEKRNHYKVRINNQTGWVEKRLVAAVAQGSKSYMFDDAEVIGYLDNPTPVYIIDADDRERDPIKLDRSFAEALRENVDRETLERQTR